MTKTRNSRFQRGSGCYACDVCGRQTRQTGAQSLGSKLCPECYELAGIENTISDNGIEQATEWGYIEEARRLLNALQAKGGDLNQWADLQAQITATDCPRNLRPGQPCICPDCR